MSVRLLVVLVLAPQYVQASRMKHQPAQEDSVSVEPWENELCVAMQGGSVPGLQKADKGTAGDPEKCSAALKVETEHCEKLEAKKIGKVTHADFDKRCKTFRKNSERIEKSVKERVPGGQIKRAAEACEPEVKAVCIESLCPIYKFLKDAGDLECEKVCEDTRMAMWNTGSHSLECKDKSFDECQADVYKELQEGGRYPQLESLMREHTVKCMCVAWRDDKSICYSGGMGIKPGTKWCEFTGTKSWNDMIAAADKNMTATLGEEWKDNMPFKATCSEFPGKEMGAMGAGCECNWATLGTSPLSLGIVAAMLLAFTNLI